MKTALRDRAEVGALLGVGQLSAVDPGTGRPRYVCADCPCDGEPAVPVRTRRASNRAILEVLMRCPRCGSEFIASQAAMYLRCPALKRGRPPGTARPPHSLRPGQS